MLYDPSKKSSAAILLTSENLTDKLANIIWSYETRKVIPNDKNQPQLLKKRYEITKILRHDYSINNLLKMRQLAHNSSYLFYYFYTFKTWKNLALNC